MAKLTAEQRIEKTHVALMRHKDFCLFSGLFMVGKVAVDEKTPTAKTNGVGDALLHASAIARPSAGIVAGRIRRGKEVNV